MFPFTAKGEKFISKGFFMALNIYDSSDRHYVVGSLFNEIEFNQPLVRETREKLSFPFGDAEMVQIIFSGISIVYGDMVMKENRLKIKSLDEPDLVELHFSISGNGIMNNHLTNRSISIKSNHHNILYTPDFDGTANFDKTGKYKFFEIHFQKERFVDLTSDSSTLLKNFAENIMNNKSAELSEEHLPISFAMHNCINDIMNCRFSGGLKLLFLQSKCVELLAMQAQAFEIATKKVDKSKLKTVYDQDRIYYAREYLIQHASSPPSLPELAKVAGINEFKLKQGFKEVFNDTVFGHLSDYRLSKAKDLLSDKSKDIKHIANDLGYSSVQHFSNAFSKKFGVSPGKAR